MIQGCFCGRCRRERTLRKLPPDLNCAHCFRGCMTQVKASTAKALDALPDTILGGAWSARTERMEAGVHFPLFVAPKRREEKNHSIFSLSADLRTRGMFVPRKPPSADARRAGWQGFPYALGAVKERSVRFR